MKIPRCLGVSKRNLKLNLLRHAPAVGGTLYKIITRLLPALFLLHSGMAIAQQPERPPIVGLSDAVISGFSGTVAPDPKKPRPPNKSVIDLTFINPEGFSARVTSIARPGYVWDARLFPALKTFDVFAKDVGQVFGIALDDQFTPPMPKQIPQAAPNIYLGATSAFGLHLVGRGPDGQPERRKIGGPGTGWMKGQFGLDLQGDPGSIYKVDGLTGVVTLFAKVMLDGVPNPGPALGNLAYDVAHKQLFASDLYTGMIHRFAILDGSEPGPPYDHGVTGRTAAKLAPIPFNPGNRPNIANSQFNSENPDTWQFAPPERRVWGLAVHNGRLFYSVRNGSATEGPQIWSVGIQRDGNFDADPRWELDVPAQPGPYPVSDMVFSNKGAMILAQRAPIAGSYDYSAFTKPAEPRVLRYWLENPDNPNTPSVWIPIPDEYAIGFAGTYRNTNGGIDLGYGYDRNGTLSTGACEYSLWTTGQNLRNNPPLKDRLEPGGPLLVHGIHGVPSAPVRNIENFNEPPWVSYSIDYDDKFEDPRASGHMGSVRILKAPCGGAVAGYGGPGYASNPPYVSGPQSETGCTGPNCPGSCIGPNCTTVCTGGPECPPPPLACFASRGGFECNPGTGQWIYKLAISGPSWINTVTAASLTPPVTVPGGPIPLNPANIAVSGPPGSTAIIEICAFNATAAASGKPYDCCRTKVRLTIPTRTCGKQP